MANDPDQTSEPGHSSVVPTWGLGDVVAGIAIAVVASTLVGGLVLAAMGHETGDDLTLLEASILQALLWVGYLGVPLVVARRKGNGIRIDFGFSMRPLDPVVGLAIGVATQLAVSFVLYWPILQIFDDLDLNGPAEEVVGRAQGWGIAALVLTVVIGAPIVEELFFRGLLYRSIERRWTPLAAIIGSSVVFAAIHLQPLQFPGLLAFGLVAATLVHRTGRLGPAIWAHIGFNAFTVALLL